MEGPLHGIKVVEVAAWAYGPAAGSVLSDMGAQVIKVEHPDGDTLRYLTYENVAPGTHGFTLLWEMFNRGKRSITIDLLTPHGVELLHEILADADVFLTSHLPHARKKLSIDVDKIRARHPGIVYAIASGRGGSGPEADKAGFDGVCFWARSGMASAITPEAHPFTLPIPSGAFGDGLSGLVLAGGISAALVRKARTGEGSTVEGSLLATGIWAMQAAIAAAKFKGVPELAKPDRAYGPNPLVANYRTSDDRFLCLNMLQSDRFWPSLCEAMGISDAITDPRFASAKDRDQNLKACVALLEATFRSRTLAEWKAALSSMEGGWDVVQQVGELADDPQVVANGYLQEVHYGDGRTFEMVSVPYRFDDHCLSARAAPDIGEHTEEILAEMGYDEDRIIGLRLDGTV